MSEEQAAEVVARIQGAINEIERMLVMLRSVSSTAGHPLVQAATTRCEQSKQRLTEAANLVRQASKATSEYRGLLG